MVYNSSDCFGSPTSANAFSGWNFKPGQTYSFTIPSNITYKITDSEANIIQNVTINGTVAPFGGTVSIPLTGNNSISKPVTVTVSDGDSSLVASVSYT